MVPSHDFEPLFAGPLALVTDRGDAVDTRVVDVAPLRVTSGAVVTFDPLSAWELDPLERSVPNGEHPVRLCIARFGTDERVAAARLTLGAGHAVRWEMATRAGEDPATLAEHNFFGFGVDAGTAAFADVAEARRLAEAQNDDLTDAMQASYVHTWSHAATLGTPNAVAFSSGFGDGSYCAWWGLDADGAVVALVIDFDILSDPVFAVVTLPRFPSLPLGPIETPETEAAGLVIARIAEVPALETAGPTFEVTTPDAQLSVVDAQGATLMVNSSRMGGRWAFTGAGEGALPADAGLRIELFRGRAAFARR
jgi:Protein of unknown function (DUF4241)